MTNMANTNAHLSKPAQGMGFLLTLMAGWINTIAMYVFLSEHSYFLTGRVAKLGKHILAGDMMEIKRVLCIIVFFIVGSYISALITQRFGLGYGLYFSGGLILLTVVIFYIVGDSIIAFMTLPMSIGGQNAATSLTGVSRTTHLTGPFTDIGINFAKGNRRQAMLWILRGVGFLIGSVIAYVTVGICTAKEVFLFKTLLVPAAVLIITAFAQQRFLRIELSAAK